MRRMGGHTELKYHRQSGMPHREKDWTWEILEKKPNGALVPAQSQVPVPVYWLQCTKEAFRERCTSTPESRGSPTLLFESALREGVLVLGRTRQGSCGPPLALFSKRVALLDHPRCVDLIRKYMAEIRRLWWWAASNIIGRLGLPRN